MVQVSRGPSGNEPRRSVDPAVVVKWLARPFRWLVEWSRERTIAELEGLCDRVVREPVPEKTLVQLAAKAEKLGGSEREQKLKSRVDRVVKNVIQDRKSSRGDLSQYKTLPQYARLTAEIDREKDAYYRGLVKRAARDNISDDQQILYFGRACTEIPKDEKDLIKDLFSSYELPWVEGFLGFSDKDRFVGILKEKLTAAWSKNPRIARLYCKYLDQQQSTMDVCAWLAKNKDFKAVWELAAYFPQSVNKGCALVEKSGQLASRTYFPGVELADALRASQGNPSAIRVALLKYWSQRAALPKGSLGNDSWRRSEALPGELKDFLINETKNITAGSAADEVEMWLTEMAVLQRLYPNDPAWEQLRCKRKKVIRNRSFVDGLRKIQASENRELAAQQYASTFRGNKEAFVKRCLQGMFSAYRGTIALIQGQWKQQLGDSAARFRDYGALLGKDFADLGLEQIKRQIGRLFDEYTIDEARCIAESFIRTVSESNKEIKNGAWNEFGRCLASHLGSCTNQVLRTEIVRILKQYSPDESQHILEGIDTHQQTGSNEQNKASAAIALAVGALLRLLDSEVKSEESLLDVTKRISQRFGSLKSEDPLSAFMIALASSDASAVLSQLQELKSADTDWCQLLCKKLDALPQIRSVFTRLAEEGQIEMFATLVQYFPVSAKIISNQTVDKCTPKVLERCSHAIAELTSLLGKPELDREGVGKILREYGVMLEASRYFPTLEAEIRVRTHDLAKGIQKPAIYQLLKKELKTTGHFEAVGALVIFAGSLLLPDTKPD